MRLLAVYHQSCFSCQMHWILCWSAAWCVCCLSTQVQKWSSWHVTDSGILQRCLQNVCCRAEACAWGSTEVAACVPDQPCRSLKFCVNIAHLAVGGRSLLKDAPLVNKAVLQDTFVSELGSSSLCESASSPISSLSAQDRIWSSKKGGFFPSQILLNSSPFAGIVPLPAFYRKVSVFTTVFLTNIICSL